MCHLLIQVVSLSILPLGEVQQVGAPQRVEAVILETGTRKNVCVVGVLDERVLQPIRASRPAAALCLWADHRDASSKY